MPSSPEAGRIEARIEGDVSGQIAVGSFIYQIRDVHGGVINILPPENRPELRARARPVLLRPRPFPGLLGRARETSEARAAISDCVPVELHGTTGSGRTSLLRHLAYDPGPIPPDGIAYVCARGETFDGVLQELVDAFFECDPPLRRLTPTEARHRLSDVRAVILVDDVELDRASIGSLTDSAPGCAFVLATPERRGWGDVRSVAVGDLPMPAAMELWEREAGPLSDPAERVAAASICRAVGGLPLQVVQAAALASEEQLTAAGVAERLGIEQAPAGRVDPSARAQAGLDPHARLVLGVLGIVGAPLTASQVALLANLERAEGVQDALDLLLRRRLAIREGDRFMLAEPLPEAALDLEADEARKRRTLGFVVAWAAAASTKAIAQLKEDRQLLELGLEWALELKAWPEATALARALDGVLAVTGRWDAWQQLLDRLSKLADRQGDPTLEGWALHQRGTRAVCLGDNRGAEADLTRAVEIRDAQGDREGAARSRHNLEVAGLPVPPLPNPGGGGSGWGRTLQKIAAGAAVLAVAGAVIFSLPGSDVQVTTDPGWIEFATRPVGDVSPARTVRVTNRGAAPLRVDGVDLDPSDGGFRVVADGCTGATLPPGTDCQVGLSFAPVTEGHHAGRLAITYGAGTTPAAVRLTGAGVIPAVDARTTEADGTESEGGQTDPVGALEARPRTIVFGERPVIDLAGDPIALEIVNIGNGPSRTGRIVVGGADAEDFQIVDGSCAGRVLDAGHSCRLALTFTARALGERHATLGIQTEPRDRSVRVPLSGVGIPPLLPRLAVSPAVLQFGTAAVSTGRLNRAPTGPLQTAQTITLSSGGNVSVSVGRIRLDGEHPDDFGVVASDCPDPVDLEPGESCTIKVGFRPVASGERRARLVIDHSAPESPSVLSLVGVGDSSGLRPRGPRDPVREGAAPDLLVRLAVTGEPRPVGNGVHVPVRIHVVNQGRVAAGPFKVSIESGGRTVPFDVSSAAAVWYAERAEPLASGQSFTRDGVILLRPDNASEVQVTAVVDSCAGDEFMPPHCRVEESDEGNNRSAPVTVRPRPMRRSIQ